ncbi:FAD-dependent oxidoreductase [Methyloligella sp. 2.7D]|uniref:FAD-dependent oxidoreductase n=1 Tax=unclassified Methyloligella TaxID=2625955 RepID=UPI00157D63E3|nr:FAD-dependent oxidoreductase [Methyloligella sp. GL2]QKP76713.1 FAD-dependent oxidoreductase [Methyloligella sp. GL2]
MAEDEEAPAAAAEDKPPRYEQTFPTLTEEEIGRLSRFGTPCQYKQGEMLFQAGRPAPGMFVLLKGHVAITQRDGLGNVTPVVEQGPGQFLAEVGQLSNRAALVDGRAEEDVEALLLTPEGLRAFLIAEADLGERIVRALILRRVGLLQSGFGSLVLIGDAGNADVMRLQNFLRRNGYPHHLVDPDTDMEARQILDRCPLTGEQLPLVICPDGTFLKNPGERDLARAMGMLGEPVSDEIYDVAIVGSGPAGLSAAVYGGSEGLSMIVLDCRSYGGQAGASARIENYFGFPTGITGHALVSRAFVQAQKFGIDMRIPVEIKSLDCDRPDGIFVLETEDGETIRARTVVVASGARYRRPKLEKLAELEGRGIWYWASPIEAQRIKDREVILVGGGNSAGQGAVFLCGHASKVRMMVRKPNLAASMSSYLIERIEAAPNIELMFETEITGLEGDRLTGLNEVSWRSKATGEARASISDVFLFIGAEPETDWLEGCGVALDPAGFVITDSRDSTEDARTPLPLESTVPGVFAIGDVRSGSVKRIGGAIGEGAQVVRSLHGFLAGQ